jgi:hypothetical protein
LAMRSRRIPPGCFAVNDWNDDVLIVDPKALVRALDRVLVYRPDDLRVRITGTFLPSMRTVDQGTIRIRIERSNDAGGFYEFDRELVAIAKILRTEGDGD